MMPTRPEMGDGTATALHHVTIGAGRSVLERPVGGGCQNDAWPLSTMTSRLPAGAGLRNRWCAERIERRPGGANTAYLEPYFGPNATGILLFSSEGLRRIPDQLRRYREALRSDSRLGRSRSAR